MMCVWVICDHFQGVPCGATHGAQNAGQEGSSSLELGVVWKWSCSHTSCIAGVFTPVLFSSSLGFQSPGGVQQVLGKELNGWLNENTLF